MDITLCVRHVIYITFSRRVPISQKTQCLYKNLLFRERIGVHCKVHMRDIHTHDEQNQEFITAKSSDGVRCVAVG